MMMMTTFVSGRLVVEENAIVENFDGGCGLSYGRPGIGSFHVSVKLDAIWRWG